MLIKRAFSITKDNIILAQPLVLYLVVISLTSAGLSQVPNQMAFWVFFVANILLSTAFFAGWMFMTKKTIEHSKKEFEKPEEKSLASFALIKDFFPGVGEYFLSVTITIGLYLIFYVLIMFLGYKLGAHLIGNPNVDWNKMMSAQTPVQMQSFVGTLTLTQLKSLNLWFLLMGTLSVVYTFLTMFLFPSVLYDTKNPFVAFFKNLKFLCKNFIGSAGVLLYLFALNMIVSMISLLFSANVILSIIGLVISFYFMTYCVVLIFLYYEENTAKEHIGHVEEG